MTAPAPVPLRKPPYPPRRGEGFWASAIHAWTGLVHTVVHQPNMKVHVVSAMLVGLVGSGLPLGLAEKVTLIFCVLLVFFAEILNSALETLVDLATQEFDEKARVTKDAAAAAVLVLSIGSAVIFAALVVHNWGTVLASGPRIERQVLFGLPLAGCAALLMRDRPRPWVQDALAFAAGLVLCGILATWTLSMVFTAMTVGLLVLALAAARERARARATKNPAAT
jgi:diacylglycerol kinase (ATP)